MDLCPTSQITYGNLKRIKKLAYSIRTNNLQNSTFPSYNLYMFAEGDGPTVNNEDKK